MKIAGLVEAEKISPWQAAQKVASSFNSVYFEANAKRLHGKYLKNAAIYRQKLKVKSESLSELITNDLVAGIIEEMAHAQANFAAGINEALARSLIFDRRSIFRRHSRK